MLTPAHGRELLRIARETLSAHLAGKPAPDAAPDDPLLLEKRGAFVTLREGPKKHLRGCIGHIRAVHPLWRTVRDMAVEAATGDPRFDPVTAEDLPRLSIEISALTPLRRVQSHCEIEVGRHGLYLVRGRRSGLLLPQVPGEFGWNLEEFLVHTCRKAGLGDGEWREEGTELYSFEAEIFTE